MWYLTNLQSQFGDNKVYIDCDKAILLGYKGVFQNDNNDVKTIEFKQLYSKLFVDSDASDLIKEFLDSELGSYTGLIDNWIMVVKKFDLLLYNVLDYKGLHEFYNSQPDFDALVSHNYMNFHMALHGDLTLADVIVCCPESYYIFDNTIHVRLVRSSEYSYKILCDTEKFKRLVTKLRISRC
jgi:hypothetical protein